VNKLQNYRPSKDGKWTNLYVPPTVWKSEQVGVDKKEGKYLSVCDEHHHYIQGTLKFLKDYRYTFMFCSECQKPETYSRIMEEFNLINQ
jgi:hypothetical protein